MNQPRCFRQNREVAVDSCSLRISVANDRVGKNPDRCNDRIAEADIQEASHAQIGTSSRDCLTRGASLQSVVSLSQLSSLHGPSESNTPSRKNTSGRSTFSHDYRREESNYSTSNHVPRQSSPRYLPYGRKSTLARDDSATRSTSSRDYRCEENLHSAINHVSRQSSSRYLHYERKSTLARDDSATKSTSSHDYRREESLHSASNHVSRQSSSRYSHYERKSTLARDDSTTKSTSSHGFRREGRVRSTSDHVSGQSSARDLSRPNKPTSAHDVSTTRSSTLRAHFPEKTVPYTRDHGLSSSDLPLSRRPFSAHDRSPSWDLSTPGYLTRNPRSTDSRVYDKLPCPIPPHNRKRKTTPSPLRDNALSKRRRVSISDQGIASQNASYSHVWPERDTKESEGSRIEPIKYKALEEICQSVDVENAALQLVSKRERFEALLRSEEQIRPDLMKLIVSTLYRLCTSVAFKANVGPILQSPALTHFLNGHLSRFINQMPQASLGAGPETVTLITQMTELFLRLLQRMRERVANDLPLAQIKEAVTELAKQNAIQNVGEIEKKIEQVKSLKEDVVRKASAIVKGGSVGEPPQNFRDVSIVPQGGDFQNGATPFLRPNVVKGRYDSVEHYLDVQFRLLREDYLIPLREGVKQLRRERNPVQSLRSGSGKPKDIRVYYDVHILNPVCSTKRMVYRVQFDWRHKSVRRVPWKKSGRLKFGSLVCLSCDDFQTMLFAAVENRDAQDLRYGQLDVRFEDVGPEDVNQLIVERESFEMVESEAYFEAYRHNLQAMKSISEENLPFKEHIVHCKKDEILPPQYLKETSIFDLSVIKAKNPKHGEYALRGDERELEEGEVEEDKSDPLTRVPVLNLDGWPTAESLGVNHSQLRACQLALTKRFAVIQGPPGTGKTYVGLKIAHALLHNSKVWREYGEPQSPILMISYTNHALDQFLHGLVDAMPKNKINIVRVGGRSKDEVMKGMTLKERRNNQRLSRQVPKRVYRRRIELERKMRTIRETDGIERASLILKDSRRCIFSFEEFGSFMNATHWKWFTSQKDDPDEVLLRWLNVRKIRKKTDESREKEAHYRTEDFRKVLSTNENANDEDNDFFFLRKPSKPVRICDPDEVADPYSLQSNLESRDVMSEGRERWLERRLHSVNPVERWQLYRLWLQRLEYNNLKRIQDVQPDYEEALSEHQEVLKAEDYEIFKKARVIGMTTTCAAKYRETLQRLRPKIILVEEAAEVLEAHVITSLTSSCEHLILIGDHQQLRPNPNVFRLAKDFKLDISLFERMVQNGLLCERLSVQHRMRPEIASLMKHVPYEGLGNHESVSQFENIKGLKKNMFFIKHSNPEEQGDESHSHSNQHEARFLVALCHYLLQQGYEPSQITMLTPYTGQLFALRDAVQKQKEERLSDVRVSTIDNFQGEENDIILLSLVRSNDSGKVGFLNVPNRTCVALSRARKGLYCIGNFDLFSKHSEIWNKIIQDLSGTDSIGESLSLICQNHSQNERKVKSDEDFAIQAPDGGCPLACECRLGCGHACRMRCHPVDLKHEHYRCVESCAKPIRGCQHRCGKLCWQECEQYCTAKVLKKLLCEHEQEMTCGKDHRKAKCKEQCDKKLKCGHRCQARCGEKCTTSCMELVSETDWSCGHTGTVACSATQENCNVPCNATLQCGHRCSGRCGECRQGRVHKACKKKCERLLICSHVCGQSCTVSCSPCTKPCENRCIHSKCRKRCGESCVPCNEPCDWQCTHFSCSKLCSETCDRPRCNEPCGKRLRCGDVCRGLCGEVCICADCETTDGRAITEVFLGGEDEEDALFIELRDCKHIFAVSDLDRYMDMQDEETQAGENVSIHLKTCPICKIPIRRSLRYGNVVKQLLRDIENVKGQLFDGLEDLNMKKTELRSKLEKIPNDDIFQKLRRLLEKAADPIALTIVVNRVNLLERYLKLKPKLDETVLSMHRSKVATPIRLKECNFVQRELDFLKKRTMSDSAIDQVFCQIHVEFTRLLLFTEVITLRNEITKQNLTLSQDHQGVLDGAEKDLSSGRCIPEETWDQHLKNIAATRKSYPSLTPLTEEERQQIVKAVGVKKGSWFKCPQGHIYAIGECGGAMERSKCPDCGEVIGGTNHRLDPSNTLAPEMDQAQYPAWSEQANMQNYEFPP